MWLAEGLLRIHSWTESIDSSYENGLLTDVSQVNETAFNWICVGGGVNFTISYDTTTSSVNGVSYSDATSYSLGIFSEINELNSNEVLFNISPNPVNDILTLTLLNQISASTRLSIYDTFGKLATETLVLNQNIYQLDLSSLPNGIYFIKIDTDKSKPVMKKFIKL